MNRTTAGQRPGLGYLARIPHGVQRPNPPLTRVQYACHYLCDGGVGASPHTAVIDGITYQFDQWWHEDQVWVLDHHAWVPAGTLRVRSIGLVDDESFSLGWGTFTLTGETFGYAGTWTWDSGHGADGHGIGSWDLEATTKYLDITFLMTRPEVRMPDPPARPSGCVGTGDPDYDAIGYLRLIT